MSITMKSVNDLVGFVVIELYMKHMEMRGHTNAFFVVLVKKFRRTKGGAECIYIVEPICRKFESMIRFLMKLPNSIVEGCGACLTSSHDVGPFRGFMVLNIKKLVVVSLDEEQDFVSAFVVHHCRYWM